MNQLIILGIFVFLWGVFALIRAKSTRSLNAGLIVLLAGMALILGAIVNLPGAKTSLGELFLGISLMCLTGLGVLLIVKQPIFSQKDLSLILMENENGKIALTSFAQFLNLLKTANSRAEEAGFGQQILVSFFFMVLFLLYKLT